MEFSIEDFYRLEPRFAAAYPNNKNMKAKMRQQIQRVRGFGAFKFVGKGRYRLAFLRAACLSGTYHHSALTIGLQQRHRGQLAS
jgi:hypothetical protein